MKNLLTILLICLCFISNSQSKIRVLLKETHIDKVTNLEDLRNLEDNKFTRFKSKYKIKKASRPFSNARYFDHPIAKKLLKVMVIELDDSESISSALSDIRKENVFEVAEEYRESLDIPLLTPNDYNLEVFGDDHLEVVNAKTAWDYSTGNSQIRIGIIEPGSSWFKTSHEDLTGKIFYTHAGANSTTGKSDVHGTRVAGVAGAATNNNKGVASIGYNCQLMVYSGDTYNSMLHAAYMGARVLNLSFLSGCNFNSDHQDVFNLLYDYGVVVVAAAGNGSRGAHCDSPDGKNNGLVYPAAYEHVISVGGTDDYRFFVFGDEHFTFNTDVDICAPGNTVTTTGTVSNVVGGADSYLFSSGTSFASPMVAATAGLILSMNQDLNPDEVLSILKRSANREIFDFTKYPENQEYENEAGAGILNAGRALALTDFNSNSYPIQWAGRVGVSIAENKMTKTSSSSWWNAGAYSMNRFGTAENGWIEVIPESTIGHRMFGLSSVDQGATWNTIQFNFYLKLGTIEIYHSGSLIGSYGTYKPGDVLRVEMTESFFHLGRMRRLVSYYKNSELLYSTWVHHSSSVTMKADVCLYTPGSSLDRINYSHGWDPIPTGAPVLWVNKVGVSSSGNYLTKTNSTNWWNAGASSLLGIRSGNNGYITTSASATNTYKMIGLSPSDAGASWNTIKYNLYLMQHGRVKIYQSGSFVGDYGSYQEGDVFKIEREDGYIKFFRNNILLTGWEVTMNEPLVADVCMFTPGSTIDNVRYADFGPGSSSTSVAPPGGSYPEPVVLGDTVTLTEPPKSILMDSITFQEQLKPFVPGDSVTQVLSDLQFYPNPIESSINVKKTGELNSIVFLNIINFETGQVIYQVAIKPEDFQKDVFKEDLSFLDPGNYIFSFKTRNNIQTVNIIKN